eukprot:679227-Pleurochrysis_carterae.AAC.2
MAAAETPQLCSCVWLLVSQAQAARAVFCNENSDQLALLRAYEGWRRAVRSRRDLGCMHRCSLRILHHLTPSDVSYALCNAISRYSGAYCGSSRSLGAMLSTSR